MGQLAQLRWEFREEGGEIPLVGEREFLESCSAFLRRGLKGGDWVYWIAKHEEQIVSQMFIHTIYPVPRPCRLQDRWGYLTNVYTRPLYRRQGIGSRLLIEAVCWAREQGFELLIVSPGEEASSFYRRAGFRVETDFVQLRLQEF